MHQIREMFFYLLNFLLFIPFKLDLMSHQPVIRSRNIRETGYKPSIVIALPRESLDLLGILRQRKIPDILCRSGIMSNFIFQAHVPQVSHFLPQELALG